jgi:hypothetical protein
MAMMEGESGNGFGREEGGAWMMKVGGWKLELGEKRTGEGDRRGRQSGGNSYLEDVDVV